MVKRILTWVGIIITSILAIGSFILFFTSLSGGLINAVVRFAVFIFWLWVTDRLYKSLG